MSNDFLEMLGHKKHGKHGYKDKHHDSHHDDDHKYKDSHGGYDKHRSSSWGGKHHGMGAMASTLVANKALLAVVAVVALVVLVLAAAVVVALLSASGPVFDFLAKNGLKGVVDFARSIAQLVWEGGGK